MEKFTQQRGLAPPSTHKKCRGANFLFDLFPGLVIRSEFHLSFTVVLRDVDRVVDVDRVCVCGGVECFNTLQHSHNATHCNTLQHTAIHCNTHMGIDHVCVCVCVCVLLCFIKLILEIHYARSRGFIVSEQGRHTHDPRSPTSQTHPVPPEITWSVRILTFPP